jgi:hypothetical protein
MRSYFFGNMYLSSIQQGIQAAHVVHDMFVKYQIESEQKRTLFDWATNRKTMILLNAGYADEILKLQEFFRSAENPYPWATFHEEGASLNFAATSVGIVLPEKIYDRTNWRIVVRETGFPPIGGSIVGEACKDAVMGDCAYFTWQHLNPITQQIEELNAYDQVLARRITQYRFAI